MPLFIVPWARSWLGARHDLNDHAKRSICRDGGSQSAGNKRAIIRYEQGDVIHPLGLLELAAAVTNKTTVQVRDKGTGTVVFVNDDSAKVELETGKKTFVPVTDIFAGTVDLAEEAAWRTHSLNLNECAAATLSEAAVTPAHSFELMPLTDDMIAQHRHDQRRSQWQYRPGTTWSSFPTESAAKLSACFSDPAALDAAGQQACLSVGSYRRGVGSGWTTSHLRIARKRGDPPSTSEPHDYLVGAYDRHLTGAYTVAMDDLIGGDGCQHLYPAAKLTSIVTSAGPDVLEVAQASVAALVAAGCPELEVIDSIDSPNSAASRGAVAGPHILLKLDVAVLAFQGGVAFKENAMEQRRCDDELPGSSGVDRAAQTTEAYLIEIPVAPDQPVVVSSPTVAGLKYGLATLTRSVELVELDGCPTACLPACYLADVELPGGRHRFALSTTTTLQTADQFVNFAHEARLYQPSHSRVIRRAVAFGRRDGKEVVVKGHGLGTLVDCDPKADGEATLQFYKESKGKNHIYTPELRRFPRSDVFLPPACRTTGLDWETAVFCESAGSGKGQVLFLEFPDREVAVLKRTDEPACELAGYLIGRLLDIPMPRLVVLHDAIGEGRDIAQALGRLGQRGRIRNTSKGSGGSAQRASSWLAIQELQPGSTLKDLCHRQQPGSPSQASSGWAAQAFGPDDAGRRRLQDMGKMIAFDVLVHNSDRWYLPGIFESLSRCGNMANIMISPSGDPVAIDNTCNAFDTSSPKSASHFDGFIAAVRELASVTRDRVEGRPNAAEDAHPALGSVREYLLNGQGHPGHAAYIPPPGHDIGAEGTQQVEAGFMSVVAQLRNPSFATDVRRLEATITAELGWLQDEWTSLDLPRVKAKFFLTVAAALSDVPA